MRLLIDSHVVIWWATDPDRISDTVDALMLDPDNEIFVSVASVWEIAIKVENGKLNFDQRILDSFDSRMKQLGWTVLPVLTGEAVAAPRLPGLHTDPFDRLLAAQAIRHGLFVATVDKAFVALGARVIW